MSATDLSYVELRNLALSDDFNPAKFNGTPSIVGQALNEGVGDFFRQTQADGGTDYAEATTAVVPGQRAYAIPVTADQESIDVQNVSWSAVSSFGELTYLEVDDFLDLTRANPALAGIPLYWTLISDQVRIHPLASSGNLTFDIRQRPVTMSADADEPYGIPQDYRMALVWYARAQMFMLEDDSQMHDVYLAKYVTRVKQYRGERMMRATRFRQARSMWDGGGTFSVQIPG